MHRSMNTAFGSIKFITLKQFIDSLDIKMRKYDSVLYNHMEYCPRFDSDSYESIRFIHGFKEIVLREGKLLYIIKENILCQSTKRNISKENLIENLMDLLTECKMNFINVEYVVNVSPRTWLFYDKNSAVLNGYEDMYGLFFTKTALLVKVDE